MQSHSLYKLLGLALAWIIVSLVVYNALAPQQNQVENPAGKTELSITIAIPSEEIEAQYLPVFVADKLGYFESRNLKVDILYVNGEEQVVKEVSSGRADLGFTKAVTAVEARSKGEKIKAIMQVFAKNPYGIIFAEGRAVSSFRDLEGKEIGIWIQDKMAIMQFRALLSKYSLEDKVKIITLDDDPINMLKSGSIDGLLGTIYDVPPLKRALGDVEFIRFSEYGLELPDMAIIANEDTLKNKEDTVIDFVASIARSLKWIAENPGGASDILVSLNPQAYAENRVVAFERMLIASQLIMRGDEPVSKAWGLVVKDSYKALIDFLVEQGVLESSIAPEEVATTSKRIYEACIVAD